MSVSYLSRRRVHFPRSVVHVGLRGDISRCLGTGHHYYDDDEGTVDVRNSGEEWHSCLRLGQ